MLKSMLQIERRHFQYAVRSTQYAVRRTYYSQHRSPVYRACVLSILLDGTDNWLMLVATYKRLRNYHRKCVRYSTS